jgi:flagellar biosynthesis GTPase FlhF
MIEGKGFTNQEIEAKLCALQENSLSRSILIPLFEKLFNGSVQFTGGTQEKGIDILVQRIDELDETQYIGIQVKKVRPTNNSQYTSSLQQLLIQLSQASAEPVIDTSRGTPIIVDRVIFVTPYTIPKSVLDNHQTFFRKVVDEYHCKVVDGAKLVHLLRKHRPDLINALFEPAYILASTIRRKLKNERLMKALDKQMARDVSDIYCDISFFFGRADAGRRRVFKINAHSDNETIRIKIRESEYFLKIDNLFSSLFRAEAFDLSSLKKPPLTETEKQELQADLAEMDSELERVKACINYEISELRLGQQASEMLVNSMHHNGMDYKSALDEIVRRCRKFTNEVRKRFTKQTRKHRSDLSKLNKKKDILIEDLEQKHADIVLFPRIFAQHLNQELDWFFQNAPSTIDECRHLLERMMAVQDIYQFTRAFPDSFKEEEIIDRTLRERLDIRLDSVFRTGLNIAVLGEAGSGKTTSLQMYAKQLLEKHSEEFVIYLPLTELGKYNPGGRVDILNSLVGYLQALGIHVNAEDVKEYLSSGTSVLLLDSIDEGVAVYPEIIDSLSRFAGQFPQCQVITSSRIFVIKDINIPFSQVSLLPFNKEQLSLFFSKWFNDDHDAPRIIDQHLRHNRTLLSVVTNPLSATILCVLYENGVPLPKSESSLYSTRLELLAGKFDREKRMSRLANPANVLIEAAKLVGYELHVSRVRQADYGGIETIIRSSGISSNIAVESVVRDFLASEIMVHTSSSELSFGHLRFQEYLASEEIKNRRSFPTDVLLRDSWWTGPLFLYAQTAREIEWIFNHAITNDYAYEVRELLREIAAVRPKPESDALTHRLNVAICDSQEEVDVDDW